MKTKLLLWSLIFLSTFFISTSFAQNSSADRSMYSSCLAMTNHLQSYLKQQKNLTPSSGTQIDFRWKEVPTSASYLSLLQWKKILILKQENTQDTKMIARIHLPSHRSNIQHQVLDSQQLIISANTQSGSQVLRYHITWTKLKKIKNLTFSTPVIAIRAMQQKLLFLSEQSLSKAQLIELSKNQKAQSLFTLNIDQDEETNTGSSLSPSCKQIQYGIFASSTPQLLTITIFDQEAIDKIPETNYYLWSIDQLFFGQDYLFFAKNLKNSEINCKNCITNSSGNQTILIQRHTLEPRLHQSESAILSWELLSMSSKSASIPILLIGQKSGNLNQYRILTFDHKFSKIATDQIIARSQESFSHLISSNQTLTLTNPDQTKLLTLPQQENSQILTRNPKSDFIIQFPAKTLILKSHQADNQLQLSVIDPASWATLSETSINELPSSDLMRDNKTQLLSFFTLDNQNLKLISYHIGEDGTFKRQTSRNYSKLSKTPHFIWQFNIGQSRGERTIIQFREYLDSYDPKQPSSSNLIKLFK